MTHMACNNIVAGKHVFVNNLILHLNTLDGVIWQSQASSPIDLSWAWTPFVSYTNTVVKYSAPVLFNTNPVKEIITDASAQFTYYSHASDKKFKTNIIPFKRKLDIINKLNPVYFIWKETGNNDYGFIAQEIETLIPGIIEDYNNNNNEITKVYNNNYESRLFAIIIKAIQDIVSDTNNQTSRLKKKLSILENESISHITQLKDISNQIIMLENLI